MASSHESIRLPIVKTTVTRVGRFLGFMWHRQIFCHCVSGVRPNNLVNSDSESVKWLWRKLLSGFVGAIISKVKTALTSIGNLMCVNAMKAYIFPPHGCHRAKQPQVIRSQISEPAVEELAIELWHCWYPIEPSSLINNSPLGINLILVNSSQGGYQLPGIWVRIGSMVVMECSSWARQGRCRLLGLKSEMVHRI